MKKRNQPAYNTSGITFEALMKACRIMSDCTCGSHSSPGGLAIEFLEEAAKERREQLAEAAKKCAN